MPPFGPQTCGTLMALLAALQDPGAHDEAIRQARSLAGEPLGRHAMTLVNAVDQDCRTCIDRLLEVCDGRE